MISNDVVEKGSLPIVSKEEQVSSHSMRLYTYLVLISQLDCSNAAFRKEGRRQFKQRDFTLNSIKANIGMDPKTIKKYWQKLEEDGLIVYEGKEETHTEDGRLIDWSTRFMARKKNKNGYYSIKKPIKFRRIPKETVDKILKQYEVSEQELKLYILLANMQEVCIYNGEENVLFTYKDLTELLKLKNEGKTRMLIHKSLVWLEKLGLVDYDIVKTKCGNFNQEINCFKLNQVNFYTDGGELASLVDNNISLITQEQKEQILKLEEETV